MNVIKKKSINAIAAFYQNDNMVEIKWQNCWNLTQDPVSAREKERARRITVGWQHNSNPFILIPALVDRVDDFWLAFYIGYMSQSTSECRGDRGISRISEATFFGTLDSVAPLREWPIIDYMNWKEDNLISGSVSIDYYPHTFCGRQTLSILSNQNTLWGLPSTMHQLQPPPPPYSRTQPLAALNSGLLLHSANNSLPTSLIRCTSWRSPESLISLFAISSLISPPFALSSRRLLNARTGKYFFCQFLRVSSGPQPLLALFEQRRVQQEWR